jgi:hypothetical protein
MYQPAETANLSVDVIRTDLGNIVIALRLFIFANLEGETLYTCMS